MNLTSDNHLTITTKSHQYPIIIDNGIKLDTVLAPFIQGKHIMIITNETIAPLYLQQCINQLDTLSNQYQIQTCILPDGEQFKTQDYINQIYDALMSAHFSRNCTLIALGGGVIGDMTGYAAACFMRGVNFIQIPTTLLAQVDSSVGGKTGINHPLGKNMIGAFWQPQAVIADMQTLDTLPSRELSAGLAEVIKYALIMDVEFLAWLEVNISALLNLDTTALRYAVKACCRFKAQVVAEDEFERGRRALLNFGHTFGHVIETEMGYGNWLHGEAVAVGMVQAAQLSQRMGQIDNQSVERIISLLKAANLPTTPPNISLEQSLSLMQHDKKTIDGNLRLILLKDLGNAYVETTVDFDLLSEVLQPAV